MKRKVMDGPVITVDVNGDILTYADKELTGHKRLISQVYDACIAERKVPLSKYGPFIVANIDDPSDHLAITAALISVSPDAKVIAAPSEVWDIVSAPID